VGNTPGLREDGEERVVRRAATLARVVALQRALLGPVPFEDAGVEVEGVACRSGGGPGHPQQPPERVPPGADPQRHRQAGARPYAAAFLRHPLAGRRGVNLRIIQSNLGHGSARTTQVYTHLTWEVQATLTDPLNDLMKDL